MINELLGETSTASNAKLSSLLATGTTNNSNFVKELATLEQSPLESLLYKGSNAVFIPESVKQALANTYANNKLDSYVSDDVIGSTAYANSLAGSNEYTAIIEKRPLLIRYPRSLLRRLLNKNLILIQL